MKMTKEDILKKLREIADGDVKINKHLNVDELIRWWWSQEAAEIVADELSEYDEEISTLLLVFSKSSYSELK